MTSHRCWSRAIVIRRATLADIPGILPLARQFRDHVSMQSVPMEHLEMSLANVIEGVLPGVVFLSLDGEHVTGALVMVETPTWFSPDVRMATELAWFMDPEYRGGTAAIRLLEAAHDWAAERECFAVVMHSIIQGESPGSADDILQRLGFKNRERTYVKELQHACV